MASLLRPFKFFPSWTCLKRVLARSTIVLGKLIRSAMLLISLKAFTNARSELLICKERHDIEKELIKLHNIWITVRLLVYLATPFSSNEALPVPGPIMVERSVPFSRAFSAPPTRDGSALAFSLLKVRHSEPTSMTL